MSHVFLTPLISTDEEYRVSYLPTGLWCSWVDGSCYKGPTEVKVLAENAPASFTFLKGGTAVVTQNSAETTTEARTKKVRNSCFLCSFILAVFFAFSHTSLCFCKTCDG